MIIRTSDELAGVIGRNPLTVSDPARFVVLFLTGPPPAGGLDGLDPGAYAPEVMAAGEREVYLDLPNGIGRSRLLAAVGRRLAVPSTARNWRTVQALLLQAG